MNKVVSWVIHYDVFEEHHSNEYLPKDVPLDGVQWIVEYFEDGTRRYTHGLEYYRWTGDSWAGGNINDLERWLRIREPHIILFGRWTSDANYAAIAQKAQDCNDC